MHERLRELGTYLDNWDDEGAPAPTKKSINQAHMVLDWIADNGLSVTCVGPDVMGGVGIFLKGVEKHEVWIACMDDGSSTAVLSLDGQVIEHFILNINNGSACTILHFLKSQ